MDLAVILSHTFISLVEYLESEGFSIPIEKFLSILHDAVSDGHLSVNEMFDIIDELKALYVDHS